MEVNIKEPIHIEFYGLPGCGKSTVSHMAAEQLRRQGVKVYEPSYDSDHNLKPVFRKCYKLFATVCFCFRNYNVYRKLKYLTEENGYVTFKDSIRQIINIIPKIKIYKKNEKAIFIWDEGLVQSAIALTLNSNTDIRSVMQNFFLVTGRKRIIRIYLKIDIETALQRMAGRTSNDSRAEQESDERKKQMIMKRFEKSCNQIDNVQECIVKSSVENVGNIVKLVERLINGM